MSNFVDYGNMTSLMTALKTAIDNAGGGGGEVVWSQVPSAEITSMADIKIGDILYFNYAATTNPGNRYKLKFSAASSGTATISTPSNPAPHGNIGAVVVSEYGGSAVLNVSNTSASWSDGWLLGSFTLSSLTTGTAIFLPNIDASYLGTTSGTNAYSLYIRSGGSYDCTVSNLIVYRAKIQ